MITIWGLLLVLVIAGIALALFRDKIDPTVRLLILFVVIVLVVVWVFGFFGLVELPRLR